MLSASHPLQVCIAPAPLLTPIPPADRRPRRGHTTAPWVYAHSDAA
jgi:hypothetical protein